jgi:ABC-2 type transport system ATP-binding protein
MMGNTIDFSLGNQFSDGGPAREIFRIPQTSEFTGGLMAHCRPGISSAADLAQPLFLPKGKKEPKTATHMIQLTNLSKSYGQKEVLNEIDLEFAAGRVHGIVGANGAGKTTLFRCIAGLEKHLGKVTADREPLKNHLGFLPTDPYFFPKLTGREYLLLHANARSQKIDQLDQKNIFELPLDEYAVHYSTGMQKKLALLAILLSPNQYYILDEPFNGVDIQSNLLITAIIKQLREAGKTTLISSHIFATLKEVCDTIYQLQDGKIAQTVDATEFDQLESEMAQITIGNRLQHLDLK